MMRRMRPREGKVGFWALPPRPTAFTDAVPCRFPPQGADGVTVSLTKEADTAASVTVTAESFGSIVFRAAIPPCDARGLHVSVTWNPAEAVLYLNGLPAQRRPIGS
jgi:hypothetical protein